MQQAQKHFSNAKLNKNNNRMAAITVARKKYETESQSQSQSREIKTKYLYNETKQNFIFIFNFHFHFILFFIWPYLGITYFGLQVVYLSKILVNLLQFYACLYLPLQADFFFS